MNNEDKTWFNQPIIYFKDKVYTLNGVIEISMNSSSSDFKGFSATNINLSISNDQIRKTQVLHFLTISDLVDSIDDVIQNKEFIYQQNSQGIELIKKYSNDKTLRMLFKNSKNGQDKLCIISLIVNETDFTRICVTFDFILTIQKLLKSFINDYLNINSNFINRCISTEILNQITNVRDSIKTLPSFLGNIASIQTEGFITQEPSIDTKTIEDNMEELENFLGKDMENIKIPEIDNSIEKVKEDKKIESIFIKDFLKNDLMVLENVLLANSLNNNSFSSIVSNIQSSLKIDEKILPGISDSDFKSISYISKKIQMEIYKRYTEFGETVPSGVPLLQYRIPKDIKIYPVNNEICTDLLLIFSYYKNLKEKLELREGDNTKNRSLIYISFRLFMDPLSFSFIDRMEVSVIKSIIKEKFKLYSSNGFFSNYSKILESYGLVDINEKNIMEVIDDTLGKVLGNGKYIENVHEVLYESGKFKIPYKNNFSLEQILNDIIPFELNISINNIPIENHEELIKEKFPIIYKDVLDCFGIKEKTVKPDRQNHLVKMSKFLDSEIPSTYKADFVKIIESVKKEPVDISLLNFDITDLSNNILKMLYVWNNGGFDDSYSTFSAKMEECILDKESIIISLKKSNNKVEENWLSNFE